MIRLYRKIRLAILIRQYQKAKRELRRLEMDRYWKAVGSMKAVGR